MTSDEGTAMTEFPNFEELVKARWDEANAAGLILYRSDTLSTRNLEHEGMTFHLVHNACRDVYDRSPKSIDQPASLVPFSDGANPELVSTADGRFKVVGNRFACLRYQCVLVPVEPVAELTDDFLAASLHFAAEHPGLTLMYNALGAGKTVPHQYWLLSFSHYAPLANFSGSCELLGTSSGLALLRRRQPCYALTFGFDGRVDVATALLSLLSGYMGGRNFNLFLHARQAVFIPREEIEVPPGFTNHRFGGLEMIGCFVMKSAEALNIADPAALLEGIRAISYRPERQQALETFLLPNP
jgi:hypothetical protein